MVKLYQKWLYYLHTHKHYSKQKLKRGLGSKQNATSKKSSSQATEET